MKVVRLSNPLDSRAFLLIAQFWGTKEKILHESIRVSVVVEYTLQVARIQPGLITPSTSAIGTAGSVMTIGSSINGCSHSKISLTRPASGNVCACVKLAGKHLLTGNRNGRKPF